MVITSIEHVKDKKMLRIFIDDMYAFSIPHNEYLQNPLSENEEITEEQVKYIRENVLVRAARERAVRFLYSRDRSEEEVINKLIFKGFDKDVAKNAAQSLKAIGYIDDNRYARRYLTERIRLKSLSKKALQMELKRKGISDEIIDEALSEFEIEDEEVAYRAAKKKFSKYDIEDKKVQLRIMRFLAHRGFSTETVRKVIKYLQGSRGNYNE
ncbi:MAG: regulatory protein RecX [Clostridiaceae bacterium]|mgnify:CR=1 FL=1|nr:regulatory protein RecX [Clostridiaceae bacterium]